MEIAGGDDLDVSLLGILLLNANRAVPVEGASKRLDAAMAKLPIHAVEGGHRLRVERGELDAQVFTTASGRASAR